MGTYTTNKNLYMPTVGEQGWGTLVNGNFETIDNFLKPITVSGSTYTFTGNHVGNQSGGSISATSISNSGTLTQTGTSTFTGKITGNGGIGTTSLTTSSTITSTGQIVANGGVKGNVTGNVQGFLFVKGTVGTSGDENYATCAAQTVDITGTNSSSPTIVIPANYSIVYGNPKRHTFGVYTRRSDLSGTTSPTISARTIKVHAYAKASMNSNTAFVATVYYKKSTDSSWTTLSTRIEGAHLQGDFLATLGTFSASVSSTYQFYMSYNSSVTYKVEVVAGTTYKVKYATP